MKGLLLSSYLLVICSASPEVRAKDPLLLKSSEAALRLKKIEGSPEPKEFSSVIRLRRTFKKEDGNTYQRIYTGLVISKNVILTYSNFELSKDEVAQKTFYESAFAGKEIELADYSIARFSDLETDHEYDDPDPDNKQDIQRSEILNSALFLVLDEDLPIPKMGFNSLRMSAGNRISPRIFAYYKQGDFAPPSKTLKVVIQPRDEGRLRTKFSTLRDQLSTLGFEINDDELGGFIFSSLALDGNDMGIFLRGINTSYRSNEDNECLVISSEWIIGKVIALCDKYETVSVEDFRESH